MKRIRYFIFLRDVLIMACTAFGGPQAHFAIFLKEFVEKRAYITHEQLTELTALCTLLPGPTSTQTITAIGYKVGGAPLAYLTLLVWIFPSVCIMTLAGVGVNYLLANNISLDFARYMSPIAVGFVAYASLQFVQKVIKTKTAFLLMLVAGCVAFVFHKPWIFPIIIVLGGAITTLKFRRYPRQKDKNIQIKWRNLTYFILIFVIVGVLSEATRRFSFGLPFRLAENFYRTGTLIFGGGQVLIPLMLTEFVQIKKLVSIEEFSSGYAFSQLVPGPTFSFAVFIGALCMREYGIMGEVLGGLIAAFGVFLPGTLLIFFVIQFWDELKKYRVVRASLEGINAASAGLVVAGFGLMLFASYQSILSINMLFLNIGIIITTFLLLQFTKIPPPVLILIGFLVGIIF